MNKPILILSLMLISVAGGWAVQSSASQRLAPNRWIELSKDMAGARRGSAIRYVPDAGAFLLWGFMDADPELLQEHPLMEVPEYDMVAFAPTAGRWRNHLPRQRASEWSRKLPLAYIPRTYSGITTGSERTVMRGPTSEKDGVARPDLNIVFDQVSYHPGLKSLVYFTGGLTAAYRVADRAWSDLSPRNSPPPVMGGSLAYDPVNDELVLFGGGHVAEKGPDGRVAGYTGTWVYRAQDNDWRQLPLDVQPPPRMNTRLVCDTKNQLLVLFGGDGQSHYLADTWLYDLKTRQWRAAKAPGGPAPRAGHFTVYDPATGWVIIGGGYNRTDLTDMWAYDAAADRWQSLPGSVPTGFYLSADIAPEKRLLVLVTNTRKPGDRMSCNILYPVRTTYGYRIEKRTLARSGAPPSPQQPMAKRPPDERASGINQEAARQQAAKLREMPVNHWIHLGVHLADPGRVAPARTWGSATFDSDRGQLLYWGGGHCGYGGNDVDAYELETHTWRSANSTPEYPERAWNQGVRLAGVTFQGGPWTEHGRKIYAYDPVSRKMIMTRTIRLTAGYEPEPLRLFPTKRAAAADALVSAPSSYLKYATWTYDPATGQWELLGEAPPGVDTLVTTRHGVMGLKVDWPARLNDAGYLLPWSPAQPPEETALYLLDVGNKRWERLSQGQPSPQNLYEMTSLVYDSRRDQVILHGGGQNRDELWVFDLATRRWKDMQPGVVAPAGAAPPGFTTFTLTSRRAGRASAACLWAPLSQRRGSWVRAA